MTVWGTVLLVVVLGPLAVREFTGSFALGGLPVAMYSLSSLVVLYPAGRLMDRLGRTPVLAAGHFVGALGAITVAASLANREAWGMAGAAFFLLGLFLLSAGSSVAFMTRVAVADLYPPEGRARGLGKLVFASVGGAAAGLAVLSALELAGALSTASGYAAMAPFLGLGAAAMVLAARGAGRPPSPSEKRARFRAIASRPGVPLTIASNAGAQASMTGLMSLGGPILSTVGMIPMGALMLGHFGGMFLPSPVAGRFADRRGRPLALAIGGAVLTAGAVLFALSPLAWVAGAGLFLVGAGWCFTFVPGTALLADATSKEERGTLFGGNDAVVSLVGGFATIAAGIVFASFGGPGLAALGVSLAAVSVAAGLSLQRRRSGPAAA